MRLEAALDIDPPAVAVEIESSIRHQVHEVLKRRGAVVGISGGVDSSVVAALCARALGPAKVIGLIMPDRDSDPVSAELGKELAAALEIEARIEEITPILDAFGCYRRKMEAIRSVFPEFGEGYRDKLVLPSLLGSDRLNVMQVVVMDPRGREHSSRLSPAAYLQLVASANFKQRTRKILEYYHADRLGYAVAGTPNLLEYDQGFFVKQGDGAADFKPIAHLYKTQVYALAHWLGIPSGITSRPPTTDTYSLPQTQEEFYFALPYRQMDLCLYGYRHSVPMEEVAAATHLTVAQVERVYRDIESKRRAARYLHARPLLVAEASEPI
jgi:NAD+ synthase